MGACRMMVVFGVVLAAGCGSPEAAAVVDPLAARVTALEALTAQLATALDAANKRVDYFRDAAANLAESQTMASMAIDAQSAKLADLKSHLEALHPLCELQVKATGAVLGLTSPGSTTAYDPASGLMINYTQRIDLAYSNPGCPATGTPYIPIPFFEGIAALDIEVLQPIGVENHRFISPHGTLLSIEASVPAFYSVAAEEFLDGSCRSGNAVPPGTMIQGYRTKDTNIPAKRYKAEDLTTVCK